MTTFADVVAILVLVLGCGYILTKIGALLYGFVRYFVMRALWRRRAARALQRRVREHIRRQRALRVVGK